MDDNGARLSVIPLGREIAFEMSLTPDGAKSFERYASNTHQVLRTIWFELPDGQEWDRHHPEVVVGRKIRLALYGYHFVGQVTSIDGGRVEITGFLEETL
jgi:hypothetical protein